MADEEHVETPWYLRWDGQPAWFARPLKDRPWKRRVRRAQPVLKVLGLAIGLLGLYLGEPSLIMAGLTPTIMGVILPSNKDD